MYIYPKFNMIISKYEKVFLDYAFPNQMVNPLSNF